MFKRTALACALACAFSVTAIPAHADEKSELNQLKQDFNTMKAQYEARIADLEAKVQKDEQASQLANDKAEKANKTANAAKAQADQLATQPAPSSGGSDNLSAFNPAISLILSGIYGNRTDNSTYHITGYQAAGGDIAPEARGFNLGESELGVYSNVDPYFYGGMNLSLHGDNTLSVEEAFLQTTSLPDDFTLKFGRFFSGIGYQNSRHSHTWDFVDQPLAYRAFLGNQFADDGVQLKWLAPTDLYMQFGAEAGRGRIADTTGRDKNGASSGALFGHVGGDIGYSASWRAGLSYLQVSSKDRKSNDVNALGNDIVNTFNGQSKVSIADFIYKWAPNGNPVDRNFKLQGEFLHRSEDGLLNTDQYNASQSGWYLQSVYQFMHGWRTGLRYDRLNTGSVNYGLNTSGLAASNYSPKRLTWMVDYSTSEFAHIRLQLARDQSIQGRPDNQMYVQYIMALGAHGAHDY